MFYAAGTDTAEGPAILLAQGSVGEVSGGLALPLPAGSAGAGLPPPLGSLLSGASGGNQFFTGGLGLAALGVLAGVAGRASSAVRLRTCCCGPASVLGQPARQPTRQPAHRVDAAG